MANIRATVPAALPPTEEARLAALRGYQVLDTLGERVFDDIVNLAALICGTPIALISLVDEDRQWFKARVGLEVQHTSRDVAFCSHAILEPQALFEVADARDDARFAGNPLVAGEPGIRFYAGAPIVTPDGHALGTVCAIDRSPRSLTQVQREALQALSRQVAQLLEFRRVSRLHQEDLVRQVTQAHEQHRMMAASAALSLDLQTFVDLSCVHRYANERFLSYWRKTAAEVEGHHVAEVIGQDRYEQFARPWLERAMAGEMVEVKGRFEFPGDLARYMEVVFVPAHDAQGVLSGVVVRMHDVQEMRQKKEDLRLVVEQLKERNEVQQRFIYMLSHDLREPVNTICNFAGLLKADHQHALEPAAARYLDFIDSGGQRMLALLDDLLEYVRLDGKLMTTVPLDVCGIVREVLADLDSTLQGKQAQLNCTPLGSVQGDRTLIRLVMQNLISNAAKFHAPGVPPQITICGQCDDKTWSVSVADRGIGIPPEHVDKLFGPFKRLRSRREYEGTGLGLATCKRIAEMHGGRIDVVSVPGQGSTFTVRIPNNPLKARVPELSTHED